MYVAGIVHIYGIFTLSYDTVPSHMRSKPLIVRFVHNSDPVS